MGGLVCWRCGASLKDIPKPINRLEQCRECHADLHVCLLCRHYNPRLSDKCDHDFAEPAREVDVANFCQYFKPAADAFNQITRSRSDEAMDKLKALFGADQDEPATDETASETLQAVDKHAEAKKRFDDLFKKDD